MKDLIKNGAKTVATAVATCTLLAGCGMESHYDEELTKVLNDQPYRPDWKGPAPLFYVSKGDPKRAPSGGAHVTVGIGDPYGKTVDSEKVDLYREYTTDYAIRAGHSTLTVIYNPKTKQFTAYSEKLTGNGIEDLIGMRDHTLAGVYDAETHPIKLMRKIIGTKIQSDPDKNLSRITAINQKYQ